jgi:hypothetical protein
LKYASSYECKNDAAAFEIFMFYDATKRKIKSNFAVEKGCIGAGHINDL